MENKLKIFNNDDFGELRTVEKDGQVWFIGKDVASILGYVDTFGALKKHVDDEDKTTLPIQQSGSNYKTTATIINESGLYSLILSSKLPKAKEFKHWVTADVLPSIRKTGSYTRKAPQTTPAQENRSKAMLMNAVTKQAKLWLSIGKASNLATYNQICQAKAAETLAGEPVLPLPRVKKVYSATELGKLFGISANKVGRLANKYNLKNDKYGELCGDITSSGRQVQNFYYYEEAIERFKELLRVGEAA